MADHSQHLPDFVTWPTFPFEGDLRLKALEDPVTTEPPRHGEDSSTCLACAAPDDAYIWVSERWRVRALDRGSERLLGEPFRERWGAEECDGANGEHERQGQLTHFALNHVRLRNAGAMMAQGKV